MWQPAEIELIEHIYKGKVLEFDSKTFQWEHAVSYDTATPFEQSLDLYTILHRLEQDRPDWDNETLHNALYQGYSECGFCRFYDGCLECPVSDQCHSLCDYKDIRARIQFAYDTLLNLPAEIRELKGWDE